MGKHHAVSGAAAWVAVTSTVPFTLALRPLPTSSIAIGAVATAGAALLLDADQRSSTFAHSAGALSEGIAVATGGLTGGHRHGLHSLPAIAGLTFGTVLAGRWFATVPELGRIPAGSALVFMALVALMMKALRLGRGGIITLWLSAAAAVTVVLAFAHEQMTWLPLAVLVGAATHLLGDAITTAGIPLLWPWVPKPPHFWSRTPGLRAVWKSNGYVSVPLLGDAGSAREGVLFGVMSLYIGYVMLATTGIISVGA